MSAFGEMVRPSLARIGAPRDGYATDRDAYWGSGFFIAPGWLLTCAHVVGKGGAAVCRGESAMSVSWQQRTAADAWADRTGSGSAVLVAPRPEPGQVPRDPWPFPDLALVRVTGAEDVPCLWLGDREAGPGTPVGLYGWSVQTGELGIRHAAGELAGCDARALLLAGSLPVGGLSGGPLLDLRYGSVAGVIKGRRKEEGVAVPVTALYELLDLREGARVVRDVLRAHDLHHLGRLDDAGPAPAWQPDWTAVQRSLPGHAPAASGITAELRTRLYGHLAQLPPPAGPGEVVHLVEDVKEQVRGERLRSLLLRRVRTWREGAGLLSGLRTLEPGGGGTLVDLDAVLLYAAKVLRKTARERAGEVAPERLRAFSDWIAAQAAGHRNWAVGEAVRSLLEGIGTAEDHRPAPGTGRWPAEAGGGQPDPAGGHGRRRAETPSPTGLAHPQVPAQQGGPLPDAPVERQDAPTALPAPRAPEWRRLPVPALVPSSATRTDVLVKVGAPMYDGRYPWSVQLIYDGQDVTPVAADDRGVRAEELAGVLREPLALALSQGDHGEHLAAIEVFLPRRLFDLPVDEWQLLPGPAGGTDDAGADAGPGSEGFPYATDGMDAMDDMDDMDDAFVDERAMPLGMRRTVVVRDVRRNSRPPSPEWRRRWKGAQRGPLAHEPLHGRPPGAGAADGGPGEGHPPGARAGGRYPYYGVLSAMGDASVPVYCGPVGSGEGLAAMKDALMAGHSVVLWRRDRHDHDECRDFHRQATGLLELAGHADGLSGPVRDLRIRLSDPDTARAQGLRGKLAVLVDPPDRPPYAAEAMRPPPLAAPGG
ncbi:trypsin-like peptidase domain-containing protein [Streptomyces sp. NPDC127190]|uniref:VMAP-C domain-containing protein n=2 Tax=unclassified Streptomyces TaxID=2593676 RepID=UPI00363CB359